MSGFCCPVCGEALENHEKFLKCLNGHSFDKAKSGYTNLLLSNRMNSAVPGDNKLMVSARRDFLNKGYYSALADRLCETVKKYIPTGILLDAGCGEGYYTEKVASSVGNAVHVIGIDISKFACDAAAKRHSDAEIAAASVFHIPVADEKCDGIMTLFTPFCREEFFRVLKSGGILISVIPSERHLWEFKQAVYDKPYLNKVQDYAVDGFEFIEPIKISSRIIIDNGQDIMSLFSMTLYYYKTGIDGAERVSAMTSLDTEIAFEILVYRKKG